ncbi:MAG TPA: glycosyltransferase [Puia sp.]|nr:glycosyltransferase [Puia sp.]
MDIVIIGLQAWYTEIGSNCKSIAEELSRNHRVLYVNMPLDRRTAARDSANPNIRRHLDIIRKKDPEDMVRIGPNLWNYHPHSMLESANWLPWTWLFKRFCRINSKRFAADIRRATSMLGFRDYVLFNDNDIFRSFYLKDYLNPGAYIYYSRDNLRAIPYWKRHARIIEPLHIAKADIGAANSIFLANYLQQYNPNSHYIGQGCNIALFDPSVPRPIPTDMPASPAPVIGYVGAIIHSRIDNDILLHIAKTRPDWNIVLVGPEDEFFKASALHHLPNVYFLGRKDIKDLPAYVIRFDVCINPQLMNEITIGNYPLKVDEYLAMGKPVVATHTETMDIFGDSVYLADTPEEYPGLIERALVENNPSLAQKRIDLARTHTWTASVGKLYTLIEKQLHREHRTTN